MAIMKCEKCGHEQETSTGKTADVRHFARKYLAEHPGAKPGVVASAYMAAWFKSHPDANPSEAPSVNTVNTQVRGVVG